MTLEQVIAQEAYEQGLMAAAMEPVETEETLDLNAIMNREIERVQPLMQFDVKELRAKLGII